MVARLNSAAVAVTVAAAVLLCLALPMATAVAQPGATPEFDAETFELDGQTNTLTLGHPRFSGDGLGMRADRAVISGYRTAQAQYRLSGDVRFTSATGSMTADEAVSLLYDNDRQEWQLTGNVRITSGSAVLSADSAVFSLHDGVLMMAELRGNPASVQDTGADSGRLISGGANILRYDEDTRTLRLLESARLQDDANEFSGCDLVYDFERERVTSGTSDCGEPVRIRIVPPAAAGDADEAP
jgi:lipopolysaccharide transport protein LptA